ncbi:MAG: hypothetical protein EXS13_07390 [Planctomycetes bacterium]|nr:hypothetical protein [Planctomycetota bacterium]
MLDLVTRDDRRIVDRFPGGVETISGMLSVVVGERVVPILSQYEVVDAFARFEPKLTPLHVPSPLQRPAPRADERCYDRTNYIIAFVVEPLPGSECSMSLASHLGGFEEGSSIASGEPIEFTEKRINLNGALTESRPRLSVTAFEASLKLSKSYTLELPIELAPRNTATLEDTIALRDLWTFEQTWAWGQTSGTSDFGAGPVQVGMVDAGGDLAFRIASGPIGTEAVFRSRRRRARSPPRRPSRPRSRSTSVSTTRESCRATSTRMPESLTTTTPSSTTPSARSR